MSNDKKSNVLEFKKPERDEPSNTNKKDLPHCSVNSKIGSQSSELEEKVHQLQKDVDYASQDLLSITERAVCLAENFSEEIKFLQKKNKNLKRLCILFGVAATTLATYLIAEHKFSTPYKVPTLNAQDLGTSSKP
jgi:hypothetical protein